MGRCIGDGLTAGDRVIRYRSAGGAVRGLRLGGGARLRSRTRVNIHAGCYLAQFIGIKEDAFLVPGRSRLTMNEALELDVEYVRCRSLTLDLLILAMTVPAVLWGGNAR